MGDDAPELLLHLLIQPNGPRSRVVGDEIDGVHAGLEAAYQKQAVHRRHYDGARNGIEQTINHQDVVWAQRWCHRFPRHLEEERRGWMAHHQILEVEGCLKVIFGGRGEAGRETFDVDAPIRGLLGMLWGSGRCSAS